MKKQIYVVPHSHYDAAWLKTYEEYLLVNFSNIYDVLKLFAEDEDFRFTLDQIALIEPFIKRHPEHKGAFEKAIAEGKLELVCGMYIMPDANMPCGESLVRQIIAGKEFLREEFGLDTNVGWMLDVFGHNPQMPQIMKKAGFDYYVFGRVMPPEHPSEFIWQGLDGSRILCHWMPYHYGIFWPVPENLTEFESFVRSRLELMAPHCERDYSLMLNGADWVPPVPHLAEMVRQFNQKNEDVEIIIATPSDFLRRLDPQDLPTGEGELNVIFQGCYSSRIEVKQWNRRCEAALLTAEALGALAAASGSSDIISQEELKAPWRRVLFNQFHDVICGCHSDAVFDETMQDFREAHKAAQNTQDKALNFFTSAPRGDENLLAALWVFNPLAWDRADLAEINISIARGDVPSVRVVAENGEEVAIQLSEVVRYPEGGLKNFKLSFVADVPGLGYRRFQLLPGESVHQESQLDWYGDRQRHVREAFLANPWVEVTFDNWRGVISSLRYKELDWQIIDPQLPLGNVITKEVDRGDLWEYNGPCKGGATTSTFRPMPFPQPHEADFSQKYQGAGQTSGGLVFAEFVLNSPFGEGRRENRARLYAHTPRIDFITKLINCDRWVRYRAAFPTTLQDGTTVHEVPFGAIQRPAGEYPAQNWIDCSDSEKGLALINRGLPGNNVTDGVMMLSLLKCTTLSGPVGEVNPFEASFEIGKEHCFEYALFPHRGDWKEAELPRKGLEYNSPLIVRTAAGLGELPDSFSLLRAEPTNIVVTSASAQGDTLLVRLYEAQGEWSEAILHLGPSIKSAQGVDLLGRATQKAPEIQPHTLRFDIAPFEICAFQIQLDLKGGKG